ncbi:MAG: glycosyltransferase [Phycisphaeraceae bacterium]
MRVLHLIDGSSPQATPVTLALIQASLRKLGQARQHLLIMGGTGLKRQARRVGITNCTTLSVPGQHALLGGRPVRYALRRLHADDAGSDGAGGFAPDLIHCWSIQSFTLAALLFRGVPRVLSLVIEPSPRAVHWLRFCVPGAGGRSLVLPVSTTIRRALLTGGVPEAAVQVLRPGIDMAMIDPARRRAIRQQWEADDQVRIAVLLDDSPDGADAIAASMATGLADETCGPRGHSIRLLVHPDQRNRLRALRTMRGIAREHRLICDQRVLRPWEILPACDLALSMGPRAGGLSLLWAMAAGVPIVGEATYAVSEIIEDHHSALLVRPTQPKWMARRINELVADDQLNWKLRDTARHEAYSFFSRSQYTRSLLTVYEQLLAGGAVQVPALEATGGLRFAGRA